MDAHPGRPSTPAPKIGAILVDVSPAYRTHEFRYAVNQRGLSLLVAATSFKTSDYRGMVEDTRDQCPTLERVVYLDVDDWTALVAEGHALPENAVAERAATLDQSDPINVQYTSGTRTPLHPCPRTARVP